MASPRGQRWSKQRFNAAVRARGERQSCPFCGNTQWHPLGVTVLDVGNPPDTRGEVLGPRMVVTVCEHCGFRRDHLAQALEG